MNSDDNESNLSYDVILDEEPKEENSKKNMFAAFADYKLDANIDDLAVKK